MVLRITTWNVNGIRNPFSYQPWRENRTFQAMFDKLEADIVVMQETKIQRKDLQDDMVLVPGWDVYFNLPKHKKGYSGVAIYTRSSKCCPIRAEEGITGVLCPPNSSISFRDLPPEKQIGGYPKPGQVCSALDEKTLDSEGRCVILEFPAFVLIGVYTPATRDETRTEFREGWINALDVRVRNLVAMGKQVFLCGDLNIIRSELDTAGLVERLRKEQMSLDDFYSTPTRRFFNHLVFGGRVVGERDEGREEPVLWDICREFHPGRAGMYTCWETRKNARPGNFGSRIDYVLCSSGIKEWFIDSDIQEGLLGSDHCPVYATLSDTVIKDEAETQLLDIMNPDGMFKDGQRLREWTNKDLLPTSAKLIPEFDKRRSIRDMFFKKPAPSSKPQTAQSANQDTGAMPGAASITANAPVEQVIDTKPSSQSFIKSNHFSVASQQKPATAKRQSDSATASSRSLKKSKATLSKEKSSSVPTQSSLMGYFKPKTSHATPNKETNTRSDEPTPTPSDNVAEESISQTKDGTGESVSTPDLVGGFGGDSKAGARSDGKVFDPIVSKESWSKLLGKRTVPKCEHDEDCQILTTKKPGINCGRSFFACSRPLGPTGKKEEGTEFRCGTFIWSSDWNGRQ